MKRNQIHVLYIEHSGILGGSNVSLRTLIQDAIATGFKCSVFCINESIAERYRSMGATAYVTNVASFDHNTSYHYRLNVMDMLRLVRLFFRFMVSFVKLYSLTREIEPDIIHLNSSNLILHTILFRMMGIPRVVHVRENIVSGYFGFRKALLRWIADKASSHIIYISEFEYEILRTSPQMSTVIYNYVHVETFLKPLEIVSWGNAKNGSKTFTLVSLGGLNKLKGGDVLLRAARHFPPHVRLAIVGTTDPRDDANELTVVEGSGYTEDILNLLKEDKINEKVLLFGKKQNIADYLRAADAVIFWADSPHFPRVVFEAWLLRKVVVYFNPGFGNPHINVATAVIVPGKTPEELSDVVSKVADGTFSIDRELTFDLAMQNFTEKNFQKVIQVYNICLTDNG